MKLSIHAVLLAMIAALTVPAAVFLGLILQDRQMERHERILRSGEQLVTDITGRLENEFGTARTMLAVFASSGWLEAGEYAALHRRARSALRGTNRHLIVVDETGRQLLNTRVRYGTELGVSGDGETIAQVLSTGVDGVSNLFEGRVADRPVYNVLRRATLADGRRRVLILTRDAADLAPILAENAVSAGWSVVVFDGNGKVAYAALDADDKRAELDNCRPTASPDSADFATHHHLVRRLVQPSDWYTCVWADTQRLTLAGTPRQFSFILLWTFAAIAAALLLGIMLSRSIAGAAKVAEALKSGGAVPVVSSPIREISDVLNALVDAVKVSRKKDAELMMLAREASHRAKNQIAIATSILRLAARSATSTDQLVGDMARRLSALGRSVDTMVGNSIESAPLKQLAELQLRPFVADQPDLLVIKGDTFMISQSAAQSFGLILHEFATNASKYGAWSRPGGLVRLDWTHDGDTLVLVWTEEVAGDGPVAAGSSGFGTKLIDFIVQRSFGGTIERAFLPAGFRARIAVAADRVSGIHDAKPAEDQDPPATPDQPAPA